MFLHVAVMVTPRFRRLRRRIPDLHILASQPVTYESGTPLTGPRVLLTPKATQNRCRQIRLRSVKGERPQPPENMLPIGRLQRLSDNLFSGMIHPVLKRIGFKGRSQFGCKTFLLSLLRGRLKAGHIYNRTSSTFIPTRREIWFFFLRAQGQPDAVASEKTRRGRCGALIRWVEVEITPGERGYLAAARGA